MLEEEKYLWPFLLFFLACLLSFGIAESLVRVFLPPPQIVTIKRAPDLAIRQEIESAKRYEVKISENPEEGRGYFYIMTQAGRRLRANTHVIIENHHLSRQKIEIRTNSLGYRGPTIDEEASRKILFLGDSIVMGDYLNEDDTLVHLVGESARQDSRDWAVINAGVSGVSLKNELSILAETGLTLEPDIVVLGFYLNDFQESPGVHIQNTDFPIINRSWFLYYASQIPAYLAVLSGQKEEIGEIREIDGNKIATVKNYRKIYQQEHIRVENWKQSWHSESEHAGALKQDNPDFFRQIIANFSDWGGAWSPEMWEYIHPLFVELKQISVRNDFCVVLLCFPVRAQVESDTLYDYPQRQLAKIANELDIPFLDLLPIMRSEYQLHSNDLFYDHCHHTPYGNKVLAKAIYPFVANQILQ